MEGRSTVEDRAAEKLLSPSLLGLCVRGTSSFRMSLELDRSGRRPTSDRRHALAYMIHGSIGQHQSAPYKSKRHLDRFSRFHRADQSPVYPTERRHTQSYVMRPKTTEQRCRLGGGLARGLKKPCTRWGAHRRHLANTIKRSVHGGDAALYQVNVITCYIPLNPV